MLLIAPCQTQSNELSTMNFNWRVPAVVRGMEGFVLEGKWEVDTVLSLVKERLRGDQDCFLLAV